MKKISYILILLIIVIGCIQFISFTFNFINVWLAFAEIIILIFATLQLINKLTQKKEK